MTDTEKLVVATLVAGMIARQQKDGSVATSRVVDLYREVAEAMQRDGHLTLDRNGDHGHGRR